MDLSLSLLLIRFAAGLLIAGHGAQKMFGLAPGPGLQKWTTRVGAMGFRPAWLWGPLSASAELGGGALLALGLFSPVAAAFIVGQMFVAIAKAHWAKGLWSQAGGFEYAFLLSIVATAIGLGGPGRYSADALLGWDSVSGIVFVPVAGAAIIVNAIVLHRATAPAARTEGTTEGTAKKMA